MEWDGWGEVKWDADGLDGIGWFGIGLDWMGLDVGVGADGYG